MADLIQPGDVWTHPVRYAQADVARFAEVTGDDNPLHLDADYAADTPFKQPIIHGFLGASIFSKILGTLFPGSGTIYLEQTLAFKRPMYVDTDYTAHVEVVEVDRARHRAVVETWVVGERNKRVIEGRAVIQHAERL
ncbi:MAG: MaoC family dehydratase [Catalinimonas sp.]